MDTATLAIIGTTSSVILAILGYVWRQGVKWHEDHDKRVSEKMDSNTQLICVKLDNLSDRLKKVEGQVEGLDKRTDNLETSQAVLHVLVPPKNNSNP
mgnify:CR=1 FL=1